MKNKIATKSHDIVSVENNSGVHVYLAKPIDKQKQTLFIFSHGFSVDGTESFRLFIKLSEELLQRGYPTILFDYRGNGYSDLEFEEMTFPNLMKDLNSVTDFANREFPSHNIVYWGMSFGCAVASSVASKRDDISAMILWSLSAEIYDRYKNKFLNPEIEEKGFTYLSKGFKIKIEFLESLKDQDVYTAIQTANLPTLLIHGVDDTTASIELARMANMRAPKSTTLIEIEKGNHGFKLQPKQLSKATNESLTWIIDKFN